MITALLSACAGNPERHNYVSGYDAALSAADYPQHDPGNLPDFARRFHDYLAGFSAETVASRTTEVYAEDAYLNDTLKTVRGNTAIRDYFAETFDRVRALDASVEEVVGHGRSWFYRWRMTLTFEDLNKGRPLVSIGVSHVVFDEDGRVAVHQDYWDAATFFFTAVPVAGKLIDKVKDSL